MGTDRPQSPSRSRAERLQRKLEESNERYALVAKATNDVIYDLNIDKGTVVWNDALYTKYGYRRSERAGTVEWWADHIDPEDALRLEAEIGELLLNDQDTWQSRYRFRKADGSYAVIQDRAYVLRGPDGKPQRIIGSMLDVTEADKLDRAKDEFTSLVSHQLRTPLTVIQFYSTMLCDGLLGPMQREQLEHVQRIQSASIRLIKLVSNILNISRIEMDRIPLQTVPTNLSAYVRGTVETMQPVARERNVKLTYKPPKPGNDEIAIDQVLLGEVIQNLIANAIHYSPAGTGRVAVSLLHEADGYRIDVRDNGIGIPAASQPRIFTRFYRADNAVETGCEGTGLGLYLCRLIMENSGGSIVFRSTEGKGTTFSIRLPLGGMTAAAGA
jgi:PAS domain S-box-containing protein